MLSIQATEYKGRQSDILVEKMIFHPQKFFKLLGQIKEAQVFKKI